MSGVSSVLLLLGAGGRAREPELEAAAQLHGARFLLPSPAGGHSTPRARERFLRAFVEQVSCRLPVLLKRLVCLTSCVVAVKFTVVWPWIVGAIVGCLL